MWIVWIILITLPALIFLLDQLISHMYHPNKEPHHVNPGEQGIAYQEIRIPLAKQAYLYGWWIPVSPDAPTIILVHGWGRNLSRMLPYIGRLHPMGYNLLAFDARSHGSSSNDKHPTLKSFSEDTLAVLDFIAQSSLVTSEVFGIVGLSIGGGAAINAASSDQRVKSVITVGALSHPTDLMTAEFQKRKIPGFIPKLLLSYIKFRFGIDFNKIAPVNNIHDAEADILLIHGDIDTTIALTQGQTLEKFGNKDKTCLWVVSGKGHSDCETHPEFWGRVETFLKNSLPVP